MSRGKVLGRCSKCGNSPVVVLAKPKQETPEPSFYHYHYYGYPNQKAITIWYDYCKECK